MDRWCQIAGRWQVRRTWAQVSSKWRCIYHLCAVTPPPLLLPQLRWGHTGLAVSVNFNTSFGEKKNMPIKCGTFTDIIA